MFQFLLGAFVAAAVMIGWRRRARRAQGRAVPPIDRAPDRTAERRTPRGVRASTLIALRDPVSIRNEPPGLRDLPMGEVLHGLLSDYAVLHGAEHAMLWSRRRATGQFVLEASSLSWNPALEEWGTPQQRAIVEFAANEVGIVSFDDAAPPTLAAVRVALEAVGNLVEDADAAALVLHAPHGLTTPKAELKPWMLRHSARLSQMIELQQTHGALSRQNRRLRGLFRSAEDLETPGADDAPEQRIIDGMLDASGASFAALVRWDAEARQGRVRRVTANYPDPKPEIDAIVAAESLVGGVCRDGVRQLWSDARVLVAQDLLYGPGLPVPPVGSLAIQPLIRKTTLLGVVVVGATEPNALRKSDLKTIGLMGTIAASALEAVWEIDSVKTVAMTDPLTGLWNRRYFDESLAREGLETDRDGGSFALVITDIDHFKSVNDTHGHEAGDAVLRAVAGALRDLVRTTDVCARIGGEEMCIVLRQTEMEGAMELAERLRQSIEALAVRFQGKELRVTASFGVATYAAQGGEVLRARVFKDADKALYRAKAGGRNQVISAR
jgi:two-component system cell cycle response regulator